MSADRVADVVPELPEPTRAQLVQRLDPDTARALRRLLAFPENTAGALMTTEFVSVPANWTIKQTLDHIRRVERKEGRLVNRVIHTYPDVSQFWTYKPEEFLKNPVYSRDYPPAKNLES